MKENPADLFPLWYPGLVIGWLDLKQVESIKIADRKPEIDHGVTKWSFLFDGLTWFNLV